VLIAGREIALFNLGDRFLATVNRCPHQGGPLCDGIVTATSVVCPLHAWKVNLETGAVERPAAGREHCVETFPTRVEDGIILIGLPVLGRRSVRGCGPTSQRCQSGRGATRRGEGGAQEDAA
jgi:nitrite reductase (NADH) small subunit